MTAPATPSDVRSERPSRFDALALALALTGAVALALTRQPGWTAVLVAACAASAVGSVRRLWLHVGLGVVGAVWLVAPVLLVVDGHTWTASELLTWGMLLATLAVAALSSVVARQRHDRLLAENADVRSFAEVASVHDPLTGLANRKGLAMLAGQILESARRRGDAVYCVFVDVDGLARVNTELGHEAGDEVLLTVAEAITRSTRATDAVARWGDDEFVVLGPGTGLAPLEIERRVRARCVETTTVDRSIWQARISAGGAVLEPWDEGDVDSLLRVADREMHVRRTLRREASAPAYQPVRHDPSPRPPDSRRAGGWPEQV
ncbi:GGDEF domain-containing protein [Angustibacter aerolatus]